LTGGTQGRQLLVQDDGVGFDVTETRRGATGYGLTSMADRATSLQGSFSIDSAPGRGTTIAVTW
jgi:signal transduction histidine kinase